MEVAHAGESVNGEAPASRNGAWMSPRGSSRSILFLCASVSLW